MDARTGETLYSDNADSRLHPASLTKMMTLYIAFEEIERGRLSLDTMVTVSKHAAAQPPSKLGLKAGQKIAVRYLIRAAAIKSANDAATALGEAISGTEAKFAQRMTRTAKAMGMSNTTFKNANGLTATGHLSSARDMSTLGRRLFYDFPQYYNIFSRRSTDAGMAEVANTNRRFLDAYKGADGIKTGFTNAAGFNLTASAERGNKRIIATVFGGTSTANRNAKVAELLDIGFGKAPRNAPTVLSPKPDAGAEDLMLSQVDDSLPEVEGGAGKTVRVMMAVTRSPRPMPRPQQTDAVAVAVAAMETGIEGALAEAITPPPPEGTLDAQAVDLATAAGPSVDGQADAAAPVLAEVAPADVETPSIEMAAAALKPPPARPGMLDAAAPTSDAPLLADEAPVTEAPVPAETLEAQVAALDGATTVVIAEPLPFEVVATALVEPSSDAPAEVLAEATDPDISDVPDTQVATLDEEGLVVDPASVEPVQLAAIAPLTPSVKRNAPIFEKAKTRPEARPEEPQVVVRVSTSGGRHFGISLGKFNTRSEAERTLLKTQLSESAVLGQGLRKVNQRGGGFDAVFMGLHEDQASLACRRLAARAQACDVVGQ